MSVALVVNADDLGLHADINRGIERAHREGIVTSASFSVVGEAFDNGVETCDRCPELDIGLHLTLVEERPLAPPEALGTLVGPDGRFLDDHRALVGRVLTGRVSGAEVRSEFEAQYAKLADAGIRPSHVNAHQHVHLLPVIWPAIVALAIEHDIPWVRVPAFHPVAAGASSRRMILMRSGLNVLQRVRRSSVSPLRTPDWTPALGHSGHLTTDRILRGLRASRHRGIMELVAHPGVTSETLPQRYRWGYDWIGETEALTDPELRTSLEREGYSLRTFSDLAA